MGADLNSAPSYWLETCGEDLTSGPALPGYTEADVAIVGAGYTGLWTAFHLLEHDPALRVVLVERKIAGWGASGRNGGWCSTLFATSWGRVAREHGADAALRLRRTLERTVDDIGRWCVDHGVDADFAKGGTLTLARGAAQVAAVREHVAQDRGYGGDAVWLEPAAALARVAAGGVDGAAYTGQCAAIHPARLVRGLARVVKSQGGRLYENTAALRIEPRQVVTDHGTVRADVIVRATEGYTPDVAGRHRDLAPVWSLVIATEPLGDDVWDSIGWRERETLNDGRHLIVYAQRTADGRVVFGGRGAPYRWGSRTGGEVGHGSTFARLEQELRAMLPQARGAAITHRWGGVLGVPRDWRPGVVYDRGSGLAWAGGYVGDGVTCAALAGRTLAALILGRDTDDIRLPWVGHRWRRWEPEPLRWVGVRGMTALMASADRAEARTGRRSRRAAFAQRFVGH
ncbi:MAG: FAD-binding oxidoreductase [Actinomycetota bacterium]|nr:FAD-binding oxidoreductase [Actinomycetota bacterium]